MLRVKHVLAGAAILASIPLCSLGAAAQTRVETVRWYHTEPSEVVGYRVHHGSSSRGYTSSVDVGIPAKDSQGAYVHDLTVSAAATVYIAVTAYSASEESPYSNEKVRTATSTPPPPPPPPPSGPQGSIQRFALWNAASDTVLDSDFRSGEQILLATHGDCVAIEVVTNAYLSTNGSPGSVMFDFDGETPGTCADPGIDFENEPPYAWEVDEGPGSFACAPTLAQAGTHSLTVTPFDGEGCTGTRGTPATLDFQVVPAGTPPPPPPSEPELSAPGRPFLVN
jgi:hypothetical protein